MSATLKQAMHVLDYIILLCRVYSKLDNYCGRNKQF